MVCVVGRCGTKGWQSCSAHHLMHICLLRQATNDHYICTFCHVVVMAMWYYSNDQ